MIKWFLFDIFFLIIVNLKFRKLLFILIMFNNLSVGILLFYLRELDGCDYLR